MFMFKKIVSQFFMPLPLITLLMFWGLFRFWLTKKKLSGKLIVSLGFILLLVSSNEHVSNYIVGHLESIHPPGYFQLHDGSSLTDESECIPYVVILSGGGAARDGLPITSQVSGATMVRLIEGIRIYRKNPGSTLVMSGGSMFNEVPSAVIMADIAKELGVDEGDIIIQSKSKDTKDEAMFVQPIVKDEPFYLVTSATHMSRSMAMFRKLGMKPVAAPTDHEHTAGRRPTAFSLFPSSRAVTMHEKAFHEYIGTIWARLRGQI